MIRLFQPVTSSQQSMLKGHGKQNTAILFHGFGDSCDSFVKRNEVWFDLKFKKIVCFEYPRPALDHWLKTFYYTTYQEAKKINGIILLYGFSLGGWFALHAAQYIAKHDPDNKHRLRVIAIAPMTHWRNFNPQENQIIPKKSYVMDPRYGDRENWQVFASKEDQVFKYEDIDKTYGQVATINKVRGFHMSVLRHMNTKSAIEKALGLNKENVE